MKKFKKIAIVLLAVVLCLSVVFAVVGCKNDNPKPDDGNKPAETTFNIKVWTSDVAGVKEQFEKQIADFNATNGTWTLNAEVIPVGEGEAATQMIADVELGADIFCFAQDQLARLVSAKALAQLGVQTSATVRDEHDASAVKAASVGGDLYCYPLTSDNGLFLYYDKSVVSEASVGNVATILADCAAANKLFVYNLLGSGWYNAGYFFGAGCTSAWDTDTDGNFTAVRDDYNSAKGLIAMKGLNAILNNDAFMSGEGVGQFEKGAAAVVSGTWDSAEAKRILGENMGVAKLPAYTVDGVDYQLGSYSGNKLLGVKPQQNAYKAAALQQLALYLTSKTCQLERFNEFGWGPSNKEAQADPAVKADAALSALAAQNEFAYPQGQIHGSWWDVTKSLATAAQTAKSEADMLAALKDYEDAIKAMVNGTFADPNAWTIIGSIGGDEWSKDIAMTDKGDGIWETAPVDLVEGEEFKARKGKSWDESFGDGAGNYKVTVTGTYIIRINVNEKTVELVAVDKDVWSIIGVGGDWNTDIDMIDKGDGIWETTAMALNAGDEFKARQGHDWNGSEFGNGSANYKVAEAGTYIVRVDVVNKTITLVPVTE